MLSNKRLAVIMLWALSVIVVAGFAQAQKKVRPALPAPMILSGNDIGFRVQGDRGDHLVGTFVVKIDAQWVPAEPADSLKTLTATAK